MTGPIGLSPLEAKRYDFLRNATDIPESVLGDYGEAEYALIDYLIAHESDILNGIDDFGDLKGVYDYWKGSVGNEIKYHVTVTGISEADSQIKKFRKQVRDFFRYGTEFGD